MYSRIAVTLITLLYSLLTIFMSEVEAIPLSLSWSGHITDVVSFGHEAVPTGISQGSSIRGNLTFDTGQYSSNSWLNGTDEAGYVYRYKKGLKQTINIGPWQWIIKGADISLLEIMSFPGQAFDSFSTSENFSFDSFPNYVGTFEYGFALSDRNPPLKLFDSYQIENLHLALDEVSDANGFLTTRLWDNNSNIVDGYYLRFEIDKVNKTSYAPIPQSPTASIPTLNEWGMVVMSLLLAGVGFHYLRGRGVAA